MKLLVVSQYYWPEPFRITEICEALAARGHSVDVLTSVPNVPGGQFYSGYGWFKKGPKNHNGVGIERVNVVKRGNNKPLRWVLNCASYAFNSLFHMQKLKRRDYDAVFVFGNSPVTNIYPAKVIAKKKKIPNVVWVLDIWPESMFLLLGNEEPAKEGFVRRTARKLSRWLYASADRLLISSEGFEQKLRAMGLKQPIVYYPNFAEQPPVLDISITRAQLGLSADDFVVGFSGNIGVAQGLEKAVEAAELLPQRVKWLIVGDGPERAELERYAADQRVSDRFVFTGWVDAGEVGAYLALCDCLLVSLKDSGVLNLTVPAKLQSYMYAGKPVVAFMNGAGAALVEQARCGVAARAEDAAALAAAIENLRKMPNSQREQMGRSGNAYCREHFDKEKLILALERELEDAIETYNKTS